MAKQFTHVGNMTGYMRIVYNLVTDGPPGQRILDLPAGNGLLADRLRDAGHELVCADINAERDDYVHADMAATLPFAAAEFDTVLCLEGLEHLVEPARLIGELCRICRPGGRIVVTTPNIQNMYSRLQFMCTGTFHQFPVGRPSAAARAGEKLDLGHIAPLSYPRLRYLFAWHGAEIETVAGDKYKRKVLLPVLLPFLPLGWLWTRRWKPGNLAGMDYDRDHRHLFAPPLLFSRSLILVFRRESQSP